MLKTKLKFLVSVYRLKLLFLSLILFTFFIYPLKAQDNLLERLGFTVTQIKSKDFTLPYVTKGSQGSLSDYRGKWVLLNFWATWC